MSNLYGFILAFLIIFSLGYILVEYDADKFEQLCRDRPDIPQCPDKPIGGAL